LSGQIECGRKNLSVEEQVSLNGGTNVEIAGENEVIVPNRSG